MGGLPGGDGRCNDTSHPWPGRIGRSHMHSSLITAIAVSIVEESADPDCSSAKSGQPEQLGYTTRTADQPFSTSGSTTASSWPPGSPRPRRDGPGLVSIAEVAKEEDNATNGVAEVAGSVGGNSESVAPVPTEPPVDAWVPVHTRRSCAVHGNRWMLLPQIDPAVTTAASSDQNPPQQQQMQEHADGIAESAPELGLKTHDAEETC
jgi:hypothetical protein